jgi:hypothetical protein
VETKGKELPTTATNGPVDLPEVSQKDTPLRLITAIGQRLQSLEVGHGYTVEGLRRMMMTVRFEDHSPNPLRLDQLQRVWLRS